MRFPRPNWPRNQIFGEGLSEFSDRRINPRQERQASLSEFDPVILGIFAVQRKEDSPKYFPSRLKNVLTRTMRAVPDRAVFTVLRLGHAWAVECRGEVFGHTADKEEARASAHKRAREVVDRGGAAQVLMSGESQLNR